MHTQRYANRFGRTGPAVVTVILVALLAGCRHEDPEALPPSPAPVLDCASALGDTELSAFADPATPRPDADAEQLVLEATARPSADAGLYRRVTAELGALASAHPRDAVTGARAQCWSPRDVRLTMTDEAAARVRSGDYTEWDDFNSTLRATRTDIADEGHSVRIRFDGRYHGIHLARLYDGLAGVSEASPAVRVGDGDDACLEIRGDRHFYIFDHASGDCPAGCIDHRYVGFGVDASGNFTRLGETAARDGAHWIRALDSCANFL